MLRFKIADKKFKKIGFEKIEENKYGVTYRRYNEKYGFSQKISILHKASGCHIVQSYDENLMDEKRIGNTCVGLTMYEMKLCLRKMKEMKMKGKIK